MIVLETEKRFPVYFMVEVEKRKIPLKERTIPSFVLEMDFQINVQERAGEVVRKREVQMRQESEEEEFGQSFHKVTNPNRKFFTAALTSSSQTQDSPPLTSYKSCLFCGQFHFYVEYQCYPSAN